MEPLFTIAHPPEKKDSTSSIRSDGSDRFNPLSLAISGDHLHEDRKKRGGFSGAKTRHSVVTSEALATIGTKAWQVAFAARAKCGAASLPREATSATVLPSKVVSIA